MTNYTLTTLLQCSADQAQTIVDAYRDEHGWHAQTVIAAAGALVGHAIQTSAYSMAAQGTCTITEFERPTNPPFGKFVNCNERIEIFVDNELGFLKAVAAQRDWFPAQAVPEMTAIVAACIDQIDGDWFPRLSVATEHSPHEWSPDAIPRLDRAVRAHLDHYSLPFNMCGVLCMSLALGYLIGECKDRVDPSIALRIGLEMAIATANIGNLDRAYVASQFDSECADDTAVDDSPVENGAGEDDRKNSYDGAAIDLPRGEPLPLANEAVAAQESVAAASEDIDIEELYPDLLANILLNDTDDMPTLTASHEGERDMDSDEDAEHSSSRAARLLRERPKSTAFGKRQFA